MSAMDLERRHKPLFLLSPVPPCSSSVVLLCLLLLSCSHPQPCTCSSDPSQKLTMSGAFDQLPGYVFLTNMSTCTTNWQWVSALGSYLKANHQALNLSQKGWFFVRQLIVLYERSNFCRGTEQVREASFSVGFTMTTYLPEPNIDQHMKPNSSLVFAMEPLSIPDLPPESAGMFTPPNWQVLGPSSSSFSIPTLGSGIGSDGSRLSAEIGTTRDNGTLLHIGDIVWVQIGIEPPGNASVPGKYSVWIDYDHVSHRISVYVQAGEGIPKPASAIASEILSMVDHVESALLGIFSTMGELLQVHTWNSTVDSLPGFQVPGTPEKTVVMYSVLGSVAAIAISTALVFLYLNSKYRRWKKEQDELTKIMQGIPGVPMHVDFADIKKATKNFHDTMKLGMGGFGTVYRCVLPASASRSGRALDVAVKKFMREVEDRRYTDFLAEVSIINRLRHKNIVPLVGWSYNKGEPLLIYEYMTNGSLDQHVFRKGRARQHYQNQEEARTTIGQWHTRYDIARDIATGLHYVHHEHEPMVLHRDIKASNIMLDSDFRARLGDFGIACTVAVNRSSVTGIAGTMGYIAPDYAMSYKATRQTDIYAFGVLVFEIVTGKKNMDIPPDDDHITDWIWRLHSDGVLLKAVDASLLATGDDLQDDEVADEAKRLLQVGLACTNPNPFDRPSMAEVIHVINKVRPPPEVPPEKPSFVWPPQDWRARNSVYSTAGSGWDGSSASTEELVQASLGQPSSAVTGGQGSIRSRGTSGSRMVQSCLAETEHAQRIP